jgi:hypothetical protein
MTMPGGKPEFCLSRAEAAGFEPLHGYRDWLKIHNLDLRDATQGAIDV